MEWWLVRLWNTLDRLLDLFERNRGLRKKRVEGWLTCSLDGSWCVLVSNSVLFDHWPLHLGDEEAERKIRPCSISLAGWMD
jgi:hypothetical protein